jgi:hypothetical protein
MKIENVAKLTYASPSFLCYRTFRELFEDGVDGMSMSIQSRVPSTNAPSPSSPETPVPTPEKQTVPTQENATVTPSAAPQSVSTTSTEEKVPTQASNENDGNKRVLIGVSSGAGVAALAALAALFARRKRAISGKASGSFSVSDISTEADGEILSAVTELY